VGSGESIKSPGSEVGGARRYAVGRWLVEGCDMCRNAAAGEAGWGFKLFESQVTLSSTCRKRISPNDMGIQYNEESPGLTEDVGDDGNALLVLNVCTGAGYVVVVWQFYYRSCSN
jgi:hypothetical protein